MPGEGGGGGSTENACFRRERFAEVMPMEGGLSADLDSMLSTAGGAGNMDRSERFWLSTRVRFSEIFVYCFLFGFKRVVVESLPPTSRLPKKTEEK